ncbi:class I tRNA ligase family protein, partial [Staphylococcus sp. SIMBA_130]
VAEVYRKIRNTFRFMLGNLEGFDPAQHQVAYENLGELDQYMLVKLNNLVSKVKKAYDEYQFLTVYNTIHNFFTIEM